ncbi:MAG TPA: hypothetical protein VF676_02245 [Flavobacterium sp.]|jgi:hypothetical protein
MAFLNRYTKTEAFNYFYSVKVGGAIYNVGKGAEHNGVITKLNQDGSVAWEKSYAFEERIVFRKVIGCSNNTDILVLGTSQERGLFLLRISSQGGIIWKKRMSATLDYEMPYSKDFETLISLGSETYVIGFTEGKLSAGASTVVLKFDANGVVLAKKKLGFNSCEFRLTGIAKGANKIGLYGSAYMNGPGSYVGLIVQLDNNLSTVLNILESQAIVSVDNLIYRNQNYVVRGQTTNFYTFFTDFTMSGSTVTTVKHRLYSAASIHNLKYNNAHFYLETYGRLEAVISKIDYSFNPVWTKRFDFVNVQSANGILCQVTEQEIILNNGLLDASPNVEHPAFASLDLELSSCRTTDLATVLLHDKSCTFAVADIGATLSGVEYSLINISDPVITPINSDVVGICPEMDPCVKDEKICEAYNVLLHSFNECIEKTKEKYPDYNVNLGVFKDCFYKFLESSASIIKDISASNAPDDLRFQYWAINAYLDYKDKSELQQLYNDAWAAVQYILQYLSQLGNCNCENVFEISDYASIQSGHLYMQSAGSIGEDSTKGIHLRWALRQGLSQHLPKANYASTTHNFNKPDDFVKVYRAKYVSYPVTIDFNNVPLQINESSSQKNWVYQADQKVFHVHFRNNIKYNQVRATINPANSPLDFIKNYGNAVLEIENKTELSFSVSPRFEILGGNTWVKTELLSVPENKITAPKGASLRRTYGAEELSQTALLSENIRSIRFSSNDSYITRISFEFYSNFIANTKKENGWNFLGKYALTKESSTAFQRLEPQTDSLQNWLRYNDQAFINVANYQTRWNSDSLPELERVATSVERYISLSNAADNPRAIEIFPFDESGDVTACNLTNPDYNPDDPEYDPYIPEPPTETTGIEIPFLDILLLGSLDYHVARILGLGTLDLNPLVFDGQYIYMGEYTSFGNLQDGLGARQVQHLYCSLPTSLSDQRLPLPIDLQLPVAGLFFNNGYDDSEVDQDEIPDPEANDFNGVQLTSDGYSPDGKTKYYTLYHEELFDEQSNAPFYYTNREFIACETTDPVFAGLEYRKTGESVWIKPELSYNFDFYNIDNSVPAQFTNETVEIVIPDPGSALYTHAVKESGGLQYSSYGINWFSRATSSEVVRSVQTDLTPANELLPPTNITATLIQKENPLLLTSSVEQVMYTTNPVADKTLVRLTFEYNHAQELIDYHQKINDVVIPNYFEIPNAKEPFADKIQVFFRDQIPGSVSGKIEALSPDNNPLLIEIQTSVFTFTSTPDETLTPFIPVGTESNYIGSILFCDNVEYVIHEIDNTGAFPKFTVFKADASGALLNMDTVVDPTTEILVPQAGSLFMIVENMQNLAVWGLPGASGFNVKIDHTVVHREDEIIKKQLDCTTETHVQKFRGIYQNATIVKIFEEVDEDQDGESDTSGGTLVTKHRGLYKITFPGFHLVQHSQFHPIEEHVSSVEWYNGLVRLHTLSDLNEPRKEFKVVRTENIGGPGDLILFVEDLTFPSNPADLASYRGRVMSEADSVTTISQMVNYYPGYKVYLFKDNNLGLNETTVLPQGEDEVRYTVFGLRSWDLPNEFQNDHVLDHFSKMSVPALMFANPVIEPVQPQKPTGGWYATRPDYFGKASYTFNTIYGLPGQIHKPYSVQFNRASDIQFLSAIYDNSVMGYDMVTGEPILNTVQQVMREVFMNGEEDFYVDRWQNLLSFDYTSGQFATFDGRTLPFPNSPHFINGINAFIVAHNTYYNLTGTNAVETLENPLPPEFHLNTPVIPAGPQNTVLLFKDFMKDVLLNCFVPLTEIPVLYNYVNGGVYKPIPKKQVIRDRNGNLLKYNDPNFDMAPMMKRIDPPGAPYESQFTDFGLDGASNAKYFYAVREINNQLKTSDYSQILGPISLVNTAPPVAPEIIKVIPVLENRVLGVVPSIQLQINSYPTAQHIAKVSIYRSDIPADALSIRTMKLVKVLDLEAENMIGESRWIFEDDFSDLPEIPFGDPLCYRLSVSRRIRYNDKEAANIVEYSPSEASKLILTNIVESYSPISPKVDYYSEPVNASDELSTVVLHWQKTCYKGKYHLYKMNGQGNWVKIYEVQTNDEDIYVPLEITELQTGTLSIVDDEGNTVYHHFKVIAENTSGMLSKEEYILTVHNQADWQEIGGIGEMIIGATFYVR